LLYLVLSVSGECPTPAGNFRQLLVNGSVSGDTGGRTAWWLGVGSNGEARRPSVGAPYPGFPQCSWLSWLTYDWGARGKSLWCDRSSGYCCRMQLRRRRNQLGAAQRPL